ncbi:MAG: hypothetical protein CVV10_02200 [Gammaproteobacteria bacterium HGW-Gammaproteobacteria-14]|nr:MAG: hypothetical protein CVV10_02200 [Gammaproteobacteria bacterium HGW-Gammaproteobacteria-14]
MNALRDLVRNSALILMPVALVACGGGGGGGDKDGDTGGADTSDAQGLYSGTADGGVDVVGLVLGNGHYYFLYGSQVDERVDGVVHGRDGKAADGSFTSSNARDYALDEDEVFSASINASYTSGATLNGTITYSDETASFNLVYDNDYDQPATMPVGRIEGVATSKSGDDTVYFDVTSGGSFSGQSNDFACSFGGTLAARGSKNVFDLRVTFASGAAGADCDFPGKLLDGVAYFDVEEGVFYAAAPTENRDSGFLFVGDLLEF